MRKSSSMELFIIKRSHRFLSKWTALRTGLGRKGSLDKAKGRRKQFFFNQRIIALQCCVNFCYTTTGTSCVYTYILFLLSLPPTHPSSQTSRSSQSTRLSFLFYIATSHQLSILHSSVYNQCYSLNWSHLFFFPCCVHKSALYVHISTAALQTGS